MDSSPSSAYHFEAPSFYDFDAGSEGAGADSWFDGKHASPVVGHPTKAWTADGDSHMIEHVPVDDQEEEEDEEHFEDDGAGAQSANDSVQVTVLYEAVTTTTTTIVESVMSSPTVTLKVPEVTINGSPLGKRRHSEPEEAMRIMDVDMVDNEETGAPAGASAAVNATVAVESGETERKRRKVQKKRRVTQAHSPMLSTKARHRSPKLQTREQEEMSRIEAEVAELKRKRAEEKELMKKALAGQPIKGKKEERPLTQPVGFELRTDKRIKPVQQAEPVQPVKAWQPNQKTVPVPFHLHTDERIETARAMKGQQQQQDASEAHEEYVPLAKRVEMFDKTPVRFHTTAANEPVPPPKFVPVITKPKAPHFHTDDRISSKPHHVKSRSELEEEELQLLQAQQFKARPLNPKVLESAGDLGVPRIHKKPLTEPEAPKLATEQRAENIRAREAKDLVVDNGAPFKAQPWNQSTFYENKPSTHSVAPPPPTKPESPALCTKERAAHRPPVHVDEEKPVQFHARAMPVGSPFKPKKAEHKPVAFHEPHLATDERGKKKEERLREKLEAEKKQQEEQQHFHARPMPEGVSALPPKPVIPVTQPCEFHLKSVERHAEVVHRFEAENQRKQHDEEKQRQFHARPFKKDMVPFTPRPSNVPPTEVQPFSLNSDVRAVARHAFDEHMHTKQREAEIAAELRRQEEERAAEEAAEARKAASVFKALPVPNGKPFVPKPSVAPLTEPKTPPLETLKRSAARAQGASKIVL